MISVLQLRLLWCFAFLFAGCNFSHAQDSEKPAASPPKIERISESLYKIGEITLDKTKRTVTFPGSINMDKGDMEYLLVQEGGKTHESLLVTKVDPSHIHIAMLLLGVKIPQQPAIAAPPAQIDAQYLKTAPKPAGEEVTLLVRWTYGGKPVEAHVEDLMFNLVKKTPMTRGPWIYNGSVLSGGVFLAQRERSIVSLIVDPAALINNTRPDADNDQAWSVLRETTPATGTPVEIIIQLAPLPEPKNSPPTT